MQIWSKENWEIKLETLINSQMGSLNILIISLEQTNLYFYLQKGPFVRDLTVFKYLKYKPSSAICSRQIILKLVKHSKFMFFKRLYWNFVQQVTGNKKEFSEIQIIVIGSCEVRSITLASAFTLQNSKQQWGIKITYRFRAKSAVL